MNIVRFLLFVSLLVQVLKTPAQSYERMRLDMVQSQLKSRGIKHQATLDAMSRVERHQFVPPSRRQNAYDDGPLPIGYGQTISQPYIVAYMTELVNPKPGDKMLEIGSGSGYQAAILAEIIDTVYTIEIVPELGRQARESLKRLHYKNINLKVADGYHGWAEHGPFDGIVVTAAAEHIPPPLIEQLKDGGKMLIPVGSPFLVQTLMLVEKKDGKIRTSSLMPVRFVPFTREK